MLKPFIEAAISYEQTGRFVEECFTKYKSPNQTGGAGTFMVIFVLQSLVY